MWEVPPWTGHLLCFTHCGYSLVCQCREELRGDDGAEARSGALLAVTMVIPSGFIPFCLSVCFTTKATLKKKTDGHGQTWVWSSSFTLSDLLMFSVFVCSRFKWRSRDSFFFLPGSWCGCVFVWQSAGFPVWVYLDLCPHKCITHIEGKKNSFDPIFSYSHPSVLSVLWNSPLLDIHNAYRVRALCRSNTCYAIYLNHIYCAQRRVAEMEKLGLELGCNFTICFKYTHFFPQNTTFHFKQQFEVL